MRVLLFISFMFSLSLARSHDPSIKHKAHYEEGVHKERVDHESVLGSSDAADEFEHLAPEESRRRLKILAERMDKNKDGSVDYDELTEWIAKSLNLLDEEEVKERFPDIDKDKDGTISWDEYVKDAFGDDDDDEDNREFLEEDKRYFMVADRNLDGKLTIPEYAAFQRPENHQHMGEGMVKVTMEERDKDKNGVLTLEEYLSPINEKNKDWYDMEKERFETEFDKNKDGILDKKEIDDWLKPDLNESARQEAHHLMEKTDNNPKDEKMTYDEILAEHELWVGSEATGYGDHLKTEL